MTFQPMSKEFMESLKISEQVNEQVNSIKKAIFQDMKEDPLEFRVSNTLGEGGSIISTHIFVVYKDSSTGVLMEKSCLVSEFSVREYVPEEYEEINTD